MIKVNSNPSHNIDANVIYLVDDVSKFNKINQNSSVESNALVRKFEKKTNSITINNIEGSSYYGLLSNELEKSRKLGAKLYKSLKGKNLAISILHDASPKMIFAFLEGFILAEYSFQKYFSDKTKSNVAEVTLIGDLDQKEIDEMMIVLSAALWSRDMVNEPVSYLTAPKFSEEIIELFKDSKATVEVFEKAKIESLKMGGLLAVNKGSIDPPTFNIIEYKPANAVNKKPIVFVGKGVVYDTGGLSLKPTANSMDLMKSDMGGGAMMAASIAAIAKNNLPVHIIGLIPATDNRPGGNAYAPGDVITMYNGKTVEVLNTDAEGRMILADALSYGDKFDPLVVIDSATLTGAAVRAIGFFASIVMGNADDKYFNSLEKAGIETNEKTVRFPFWDEYNEDIKSKIADIKNVGGASAGMITAGKFLENFTKSPYIHIDIAGPSFTQSPKDYYSYGGTGYGVRLMYNFIKNFADGK